MTDQNRIVEMKKWERKDCVTIVKKNLVYLAQQFDSDKKENEIFKKALIQFYFEWYDRLPKAMIQT